MMPPFVVFPTNRIAHFVEVSLYLFYLAQRVNLVVLYQQHGKEFLICSLGSQSDSSRYDDVNYILKTIDESDYLTK